MSPDKRKEYWQRNIRIVLILLSIWFLVSYVFSIFLVDALNSISIGGAKLGFWFAQQGSIYVFVVLIYVYVKYMNKLDKEYDVHEWDQFKLHFRNLNSGEKIWVYNYGRLLLLV